MPSFPVPVLGFLFVSFRPSLIRFPQLFLGCFPYALALGIFRFPSGFFRPRRFSPSSTAGFPSASFRFCLLSFLFVSFRPSSLRSHSCSTSACLPLSPSACSLPIHFLSSAFLPVLTTQPSVLPFRSSRFHLSVVFPVRASAFASSLSPFSPA